MLLDLNQEVVSLTMPQMLAELNEAAAKGQEVERALIVKYLKTVSIHPSMNKRLEHFIKAIERGDHDNRG